MRERFNQHLDDQAPAIATGEGETFQKILCSQRTEIKPRLFSVHEGQIQHLVYIFLTGQIDRREVDSPKQSNQLLLFRNVGGKTWNSRQNKHERPARILQQG